MTQLLCVASWEDVVKAEDSCWAWDGDWSYLQVSLHSLIYSCIFNTWIKESQRQALSSTALESHCHSNRTLSTSTPHSLTVNFLDIFLMYSYTEPHRHFTRRLAGKVLKNVWTDWLGHLPSHIQPIWKMSWKCLDISACLKAASVPCQQRCHRLQNWIRLVLFVCPQCVMLGAGAWVGAAGGV